LASFAAPAEHDPSVLKIGCGPRRPRARQSTQNIGARGFLVVEDPVGLDPRTRPSLINIVICCRLCSSRALSTWTGIVAGCDGSSAERAEPSSCSNRSL
jgi:hypothetical protein